MEQAQSRRFRNGIGIGAMGVLVLVIGLIVWSIVGRGAPAEEPTPSPSDTTPMSQRTWVKQIQVDNYGNAVQDIGLDTVAAIITHDNIKDGQVTVHGMDLRTGTEIWSKSGNRYNTIVAGDNDGLVLELSNKLMVVDPTTGQVTAQVSLSQYKHLLWAGNGLILTEDSDKDVLCVSTVKFPGRCLWKAPYLSGSLGNCPDSKAYGYMFGDWVNTGKGVRDLATGHRAGFGKDAGENGKVLTYYCGIPGRVYKVTVSTDLQTSGTSYQLWDTDTDSAISAPLADPIYWVDPDSDVFTIYHQGSSPIDRSTVTAYNWQTGEQLWRVPVNMRGSNGNDQLIDGYWITDADYTITAYDIMTGQIAWHSQIQRQIVGLRNGLLYTRTLFDLAVVDPANGFSLVQNPDLPPGNQNNIKFTEHLVYYVDRDYMLWVLQ